MINKILGIAINEYDDLELDKINNCANDINKIVSILTARYVFDNIEILFEKEQTTRKFLYNRLYEYLLNALEDENILILYAGHGEYNEFISSTYWLPSDANPSDQSTWFNISDLLNFIKNSKAFHVGIISDSCFSGAIFESAGRGGGLKALSHKKSRLALTSGSIEKVSDGIEGKLSPFTETLSELLSKNSEKEITFSSLANNLILDFNLARIQTPMFGSLANVGHEGGSFVFQLKEDIEEFDFTEISLGLNIDFPINIDYNCVVPMFSKNKFFDNNFVNTYIQQLAYSLISKTRLFISDDKDYIINLSKEKPFYLNISYTVEKLTKTFLSLIISYGDNFGGVHPNDYLYSLNIAFNPERKVDLYDVIRFNNFEEFIKNLIAKFSYDEEQKEILETYSKQISSHDLDFSLTNDTLNLYFINHMPRVVQALGILEIPITELEFKIEQID